MINVGKNVSKQVSELKADTTQRAINAMYPPAPLVAPKGDGVADDTNAIQAIINAIATVGGGTVLLPKGTYNFTNLVMTSRITLMGIGNPVLSCIGTGDAILSQSSQYTKNKIKDLTIQRATKTGNAIKIKLSDGTWGACTDIDNVTIDGFQYGVFMVQAYNCHFDHVRTLSNNDTAFGLFVTDTGTYPASPTFCNENKFDNCSFKGTKGFELCGAFNNRFTNCSFEFHQTAIYVYTNTTVTPNVLNVENHFDNCWFESITQYVVCNYKLDGSGNVITNTRDDLKRALSFTNPYGVKELLPTNQIPTANDNYDLYKIGYGKQSFQPVEQKFQVADDLVTLYARNEKVMYSAHVNDPSLTTRTKDIFKVSNKGVFATLAFNNISAAAVDNTVTGTTPNTLTLMLDYSKEIADRTSGSSTTQINKIATTAVLTLTFYLYNGNYAVAQYHISDVIYGNFVNMRMQQNYFNNNLSVISSLSVTSTRLTSPKSNKQINISATGAGIMAMRADITYLPLGPMTTIVD